MNLTNLKGIALSAILGAGMIATGAQAGITAGAGDVILGFRATAGQGASTYYNVNLGQVTQFTGAANSFAVPGLGNIGTDLTAIYGANWQSRTDLFFGVIGATDTFVGVGGEPAKTIYASKTRTSVSTPATSWNRASDAASGIAQSNVNALRSGLFFGTTTANSTKAVTTTSSDGNNYASFVTPSADFGLYNSPGIEVLPANTADFFKMTVGSGAGTHLGSFKLTSNGVVFTTPSQHSDYVNGTGLFATGGEYTISPSTQNVTNGSTSVQVTVSRTGGLAAGTVAFATNPGTATTPANFTDADQTLSFDVGETSKTVTITLSGTAVPSTKVFTATIASASNGTIGAASSATIRLLSATPDLTAPVVAITAPANNAIVKEPTTPSGTVKIEGTLNGTTGDPTISTVTVSINGGAAIPAVIDTAKKKWTVTFTGAAAVNAALQFGNNTVVATGTDVDFNVGTSNTVTFFYEALRDISVTVTPAASGTLTFTPGLATGSKAIVGRPYTVVAKPAVGFFFDSWSGTAGFSTTTGTSTTFTHVANNTVVANFVASPFTINNVSGTYNGIVQGDAPATNTQANAGLFTATVTVNTGAFTGKLLLNGVSSPVAGVFNNVTKTFTSTVSQNGFNYSLTLDTTGPHAKITGTVVTKKRGVDIATLDINAPLTHTKTTATGANLLPVPSGSVAVYNVGFSVPTDVGGNLLADEYPAGKGYGILTIKDTDVSAKMVGILADGTAYTSAALLCRDGTVPVYAAFASGVGALVGNLTVDTSATTTDVTGADLFWFKSENKGQYYPWGFDAGLTIDATGAKLATSTVASLALTTNPHAVFSGGPFTTSIDKTLVLLGTSYVSTPNATDKSTKVTFNATTGVATIEYTSIPGVLTSKHAGKGIVVGKGGTSAVYAHFLTPVPTHTDGSGQGGLVTIVP